MTDLSRKIKTDVSMAVMERLVYIYKGDNKKIEQLYDELMYHDIKPDHAIAVLVMMEVEIDDASRVIISDKPTVGHVCEIVSKFYYGDRNGIRYA